MKQESKIHTLEITILKELNTLIFTCVNEDKGIITLCFSYVIAYLFLTSQLINLIVYNEGLQKTGEKIYRMLHQEWLEYYRTCNILVYRYLIDGLLNKVAGESFVVGTDNISPIP